MSAEPLKPCPFCGGQPATMHRQGKLEIRCADMTCAMAVYTPWRIPAMTDAEVVECWNRRSGSAPATQPSITQNQWDAINALSDVLDDAAVVLNRARVANRAMGLCARCDGPTSTSTPPHLCQKCALDAIRRGATDLRLLLDLVDRRSLSPETPAPDTKQRTISISLDDANELIDARSRGAYVGFDAGEYTAQHGPASEVFTRIVKALRADAAMHAPFESDPSTLTAPNDA